MTERLPSVLLPLPLGGVPELPGEQLLMECCYIAEKSSNYNNLIHSAK